MGDKPISFKDKDGNFVSAADVWNAEKLEELFNLLNPNRRLRLERDKLKRMKLKCTSSQSLDLVSNF
ncbi:UDP-N-acetylglucosamine 1-carboxyvinyltransferase [Streptococcus equi subsp. zooepidemicus]|nr:UDP-N-acetylglucosamine 1-carboxyvinyltransferase [Streptococcus equi subsp. zooepidemicus]